MDRFEQFVQTLNHHRVAVGGLALAITLGAMTGSVLKPSGLLEEPMAAQLIASQPSGDNASASVVLEPWPTNNANRPWVAGTDFAKAMELPRLSASYDVARYDDAMHEATVEESTPSVMDQAVDAVAEESVPVEPDA